MSALPQSMHLVLPNVYISNAPVSTTSTPPPSRKRANEEMSSLHPHTSTAHHDDDDSSESSTKRSRNVEGRPVTTQAHPPSLVLHVRALPTFTTEQELIGVLSPYGQVVRAFITQHNHQAFVQMSSLEGAEAVVAHSAQPPGFAVRGRQIFVQYSNRKEVVPPPNQNASMNMTRDQAVSGYSTPGHRDRGDETPNHILLLSVSNLRVSVTLDHIHQICKSYGAVKKIITFMKGQVFKALVQFWTLEHASMAKVGLEGKDIFQSCCHVTASYSSQTDLKITNESAKARDFSLESKDQPSISANSSNRSSISQPQPPSNPSQQQPPSQPQQMMPMGMMPMGAYGAFGPSGTGVMNPMAMQMNPYAMNPYQHMATQMGYMPYGGAGVQQQHPGVFTAGAAPAGAQPTGGSGCVLLVSGLPITADITPDTLFALFGNFGDVLRVKILYNNRDRAMIQFSNSTGCSQAIQHLHHAQFGDKQLNVTLSHHETISMPKATDPTADTDSNTPHLTQDFTNSKLHRFRGKPIIPKNIHSPSQILHVANIADGVTESELQQIFGPATQIQFFIKDRHMAYVKLPSASESILTLMRTHNYKLNNRFLRVSFSGKDVASFDIQQNGTNANSNHTTNTQPTSSTTTSATASTTAAAPAHNEFGESYEETADGLDETN